MYRRYDRGLCRRASRQSQYGLLASQANKGEDRLQERSGAYPQVRRTDHTAAAKLINQRSAPHTRKIPPSSTTVSRIAVCTCTGIRSTKVFARNAPGSATSPINKAKAITCAVITPAIPNTD